MPAPKAALSRLRDWLEATAPRTVPGGYRISRGVGTELASMIDSMGLAGGAPGVYWHGGIRNFDMPGTHRPFHVAESPLHALRYAHLEGYPADTPGYLHVFESPEALAGLPSIRLKDYPQNDFRTPPSLFRWAPEDQTMEPRLRAVVLDAISKGGARFEDVQDLFLQAPARPGPYRVAAGPTRQAALLSPERLEMLRSGRWARGGRVY